MNIPDPLRTVLWSAYNQGCNDAGVWRDDAERAAGFEKWLEQMDVQRLITAQAALAGHGEEQLVRLHPHSLVRFTDANMIVEQVSQGPEGTTAILVDAGRYLQKTTIGTREEVEAKISNMWTKP